jgi:hypothetical protein
MEASSVAAANERFTVLDSAIDHNEDRYAAAFSRWIGFRQTHRLWRPAPTLTTSLRVRSAIFIPEVKSLSKMFYREAGPLT